MLCLHTETAQRMGVSQMQVSRLERRALSRLHAGAAQVISAIEELPAADQTGRSKRK